VKFSDYDILDSLNQVIRYLSISLANRGDQYLQHVKDYNEDEVNQATIDEYTVYGSSAFVSEDEREVFSTDEIDDNADIVSFPLTGVKLPEGYTSIISVQDLEHGRDLSPATSLAMLNSPRHYGMYFIAGDRIYVKTKSFRLNYYAPIAQVKTIDDEIDLPSLFLDTLVMLTRMVLNNNGQVETMADAFDRAIDHVLPRRRYSNIRQRMPFYC
jgi:hypothetical protein